MIFTSRNRGAGSKEKRLLSKLSREMEKAAVEAKMNNGDFLPFSPRFSHLTCPVVIPTFHFRRAASGRERRSPDTITTWEDNICRSITSEDGFDCFFYLPNIIKDKAKVNSNMQPDLQY
jgi:hypothetical protein